MRVLFKMDVIGWGFSWGTRRAFSRWAWYSIAARIASKTAVATCLPRPFLRVRLSTEKTTKIRGNRHGKPARNLSRPSLQHRKTVRKQDARRYRRKTVRI